MNMFFIILGNIKSSFLFFIYLKDYIKTNISKILDYYILHLLQSK